MTRHHWRESIKSFFGSHIDPEKEEQLRGSKTGDFLYQGLRRTFGDCEMVLWKLEKRNLMTNS